MDAIFNRGYSCPNASWNGTFISFCPGMTSDDVTGHEWTHAYTEYTDNLIYQWQPGALNEVVLGHLRRDDRPHQRSRRRHAEQRAHGRQLLGVRRYSASDADDHRR